MQHEKELYSIFSGLTVLEIKRKKKKGNALFVSKCAKCATYN